MKRPGKLAKQPIRGVNLGNWLVLERWMESEKHPGPFAGTTADDERGLRDELDNQTLEARLQHHRDTYVTYDTFAWLADHGCNLVRLPVPYFAFGTNTYGSCIEYVDKAMNWAEQTNMPVLLDLHTVPGGQNGFDNGGVCGLCTWHQRSERIARTFDVLQKLAERYAGHPTLFGFEPMNEPASPKVFKISMQRYGENHPQRVELSTPIPTPVLMQYYRLVYERIRPILGSSVALVFHDQFRLAAWHKFMPKDRYPNVWIDTHQYISTLAKGLNIKTMAGHIAATKVVGLQIARSQRYHPTLVGEWSLSNNIAKMKDASKEDKLKMYSRYAAAQLAAFERGEGACFWSQTNGQFTSWSFEKCTRNGWLDYKW